MPRPSLNEKLFPVHRPTGFKMCDWNILFIIVKKSLFLTYHTHHTYILFNENENQAKQKIFRPPNWPPSEQETIPYLRMARGKHVGSLGELQWCVSYKVTHGDRKI